MNDYRRICKNKVANVALEVVVTVYLKTTCFLEFGGLFRQQNTAELTELCFSFREIFEPN